MSDASSRKGIVVHVLSFCTNGECRHDREEHEYLGPFPDGDPWCGWGHLGRCRVCKCMCFNGYVVAKDVGAMISRADIDKIFDEEEKRTYGYPAMVPSISTIDMMQMVGRIKERLGLREVKRT